MLHRSKTPLELFFDHCFVVAVAQASSLLHHDLSGSRIGHALGNLPLGVSRSGGLDELHSFASAYDNDDDPYRLLTMVLTRLRLVRSSSVDP